MAAKRARAGQGKISRPRVLDIRSGDTVLVIAGDDRGKRGVVERTLATERRIVVGGVNLHKRHQRSGASRGGTTTIQGGIIDFPAPIHYSNVRLICNRCQQPTRLKRQLEGEAYFPVCGRCGQRYERVLS